MFCPAHKVFRRALELLGGSQTSHPVPISQSQNHSSPLEFFYFAMLIKKGVETESIPPNIHCCQFQYFSSYRFVQFIKSRNVRNESCSVYVSSLPFQYPNHQFTTVVHFFCFVQSIRLGAGVRVTSPNTPLYSPKKFCVESENCSRSPFRSNIPATSPETLKGVTVLCFVEIIKKGAGIGISMPQFQYFSFLPFYPSHKLSGEA